MPDQPAGTNHFLDRVRAFAQSARVPTRAGRRCIDGRYPPGSADSGRLARPGGDLGYLLAVLAANRALRLGWDVETCAARVYRAVTALDGGFFIHTDHLARSFFSPVHDAAGCGHISASVQNPTAYGLDANETIQACDRALELARRDGALHTTVLEEQHAEQAVLLVRGRAHSLESSLPGYGQYFLYDSDRDREFLGKLAAALGFSGGDARELSRISRRQLDASLSLLAGSLPLFTVAVDGDEPEVQPGAGEFATGMP